MFFLLACGLFFIFSSWLLFGGFLAFKDEDDLGIYDFWFVSILSIISFESGKYIILKILGVYYG